MMRYTTRTITHAITKGPKHHFFGYYDKCPWDPTGEYILALETKFMHRPPKVEDTAAIGIINLSEGNAWEQVGHTYAWNWQQGCMLQWLPTDSGAEIIYNDYQDEQSVAVVTNLQNGKTRILPRPIYAVSHDGKSALSLNFARLNRLRPGYGYQGIPDDSKGILQPGDDGIFLMDLLTGESKLIVSISHIAAIGDTKEFGGEEHWFNHLLFSKDDRRFAFLHRWRPQSEDKKVFNFVNPMHLAHSWLSSRIGLWRSLVHFARRAEDSWGGLPFRIMRRFLNLGMRPNFKTRMFTANTDGSSVYCIASDDLVSHFDWRDSCHM